MKYHATILINKDKAKDSKRLFNSSKTAQNYARTTINLIRNKNLFKEWKIDKTDKLCASYLKV